MSKCRLLWFFALGAVPLIANPQVISPAEYTAACVPQAYIANLLPIFQPFAALPESAYEKFDDTGATNVWVTVLVTIGPDGRVTGTEALGGPEFLRKTSTDTVRHYKYQSVIRNGQPVCALTSADVSFRTPGKLLAPLDSASERVARERLQAVQKQWLRTPEQVFADMQQELDVPGGLRRTLALPRLAKAALAADEMEKAVAYAQEGLGPGSGGQSMFDCNMVLGEVALRNGNVAEAAQYLIASGKSPGSPALNSFGPNMSLAKALLEKGQVDVVLASSTSVRRSGPIMPNCWIGGQRLCARAASRILARTFSTDHRRQERPLEPQSIHRTRVVHEQIVYQALERRKSKRSATRPEYESGDRATSALSDKCL